MDPSGRYSIKHFDEIDSTNSYLLDNLDKYGDKQVIIAKRQKSGRGRLNRKWISDKIGNLYMSILLKPPRTNNQAKNNLINITQFMCVCICKVLEGFEIKPSIKWPNDVLVANKKISGILSEVRFRADNYSGLVLGVGVNLNLSQSDLNRIDQPATSLNMFTKETVDVFTFAQDLLREFFINYETFINKGFLSIKDDYTKRNNFLNKKVIIKLPNKNEVGVITKINADGTLTMKKDTDEDIIVNMGDLIC